MRIINLNGIWRFNILSFDWAVGLKGGAKNVFSLGNLCIRTCWRLENGGTKEDKEEQMHSLFGGAFSNEEYRARVLSIVVFRCWSMGWCFSCWLLICHVFLLSLLYCHETFSAVFCSFHVGSVSSFHLSKKEKALLVSNSACANLARRLWLTKL